MITKKLSTKKVAVTPPEIESLVKQVQDAPESDLPSLLRSLIPPNAPYVYPRGDLHAFIPLLNRFDGLLEAVILEYEVDSVQKRPFEEGKRELILEILRVERLVLDNTTSRKIYASYDRLQSLLFTSDLQILHATILLLLRPAQQYSSHTPFELSTNAIVKSRLLRLAEGGLGRTWGKAKEDGWGLKELEGYTREGEGAREGDVTRKKMSEVPEEWFNLQMSFYKPSTTSSSSEDAGATAGKEEAGPDGATELEKPTQDLRLAGGSGSEPTLSESTPGNVGRAGEESMSIDPPSPMDTPVRPRAAVMIAGRARSGLAQSAMLDGVDTATGNAPSTPKSAVIANVAAGEALTPAKTQAGVGASGGVGAGKNGTLTVSPFSRCYVNADGQVTLSIFSTGLLALLKDEAKGSMDVLLDIVGHHPELLDESVREDLFELLCRLRVIMALRPESTGEVERSRKEETRSLLEIRIIALATYFHLSTESVAQTDLFLYDTSVIPQLAELIVPSHHTDDRILAAAFLALDACARYKSRTSEVLMAVNANVAHGMLLAGFTNLIKRLQVDEEEVPHDLVDAEIAFVSFAATASGYGSTLVGAGILPVLIECFKIRGVSRGGYVARAIGLIDSILYGSSAAFNIFVTAGGIDVLNARIAFEIDRFLDPIATPDDLTSHELIRRSTPLKLSLRSLHRMMQAPGTTEGLRNLIDSELPKSLQKIFENPNRVGSPSLAIAINITATFVHNEPTSLAVIQEMKLPEALYNAVQGVNKASFELLSATTNAISALCLNQAGMDLTLSRPQIIRNLVDCVRNPEYRDILRERDNAIYIGSALDELARHHVPLKQLVLDATIGMLKHLLRSGLRGRSKGITTLADYKLVRTVNEDEAQSTESAIAGQGSDQTPAAAEASASVATEAPISAKDVDASDKMQVEQELLPKKPAEDAEPDESPPEMHFDACIELASQFMQGLFHNQSLARDFVKVDGHKLVLKLLGSPALLAQQATTETMHAVSSILRILAEANLGSVLHAVIKSCRKAMETCKPLWQREGLLESSCLATLLEIRNANDLDSYNAKFRQVVHLANLLGVLSTLYAVVGYGHTKVTLAFLVQIGSSQHSSFLDSLGSLHRACLWENIWLKAHHGPKSGISSGIASPGELKLDLNDQILSPSIEVTEQLASFGAVPPASESGSKAEDSAGPSCIPTAVPPESSPRVISPNYANVKYLAVRIPAFLGPFFQGLVKMLVIKRMDSAHRKEAIPTAYQLSKVMLKHLARAPPSDPLVSKAYDTAMIGLVTLLLFDERGPTSNLQLFLLQSFSRQGGITAIADNLRAAVETLNSRGLPISQPTEPGPRHQLIQDYGHLHRCLDLTKGLVGRKIFESPHLTTLTSRDSDREKPDYFNPTELLVDVRLALIDTVTAVWEADWLAEAPLPVIASAIQAVNLITSAVPELPSQPGSTSAGLGAAGLASVLASAAAVPRPPFVLNDAYHATLQEMGFTANQSRFALTRLNNNLPGATEYLLTHAHLIVDQPAPAPAAPQPPAPPAAPDAALPAVVPVDSAPLQVVGDDVDMSSDSEDGVDAGT